MRVLRTVGLGVVTVGAFFVVLLNVGSGSGTSVTVRVPPGSTLPEVADILEDHGIVPSARLFHAWARIRGADRDLKAGTYRLETGSSVREALRTLTRGEVATVSLAIPEGFTLAQMAPRISAVTGVPESEILDSLSRPEMATAFEVPGPTLEGFLFPDTYFFAEGVPLGDIVREMTDRYRAAWTEERRARLQARGLTEAELVTLASIIQAEARQVQEMPRIAGVYHNRLQRGWRLEADPTVLYALGGHRPRLLFAAIDSVADNPYNTYAHAGLPPGPIGSPGDLALDAALTPEEHDFMFFVARPDGSHIFTRSLREHNRAIQEARRD